MNRDMLMRYEKYLHEGKDPFHTAFKPYRQVQVYDKVFPDTLWGYKRYSPDKGFNKFLNVILHEDLLSFDENGLVRYARRDTSEIQAGVLLFDIDTAYRPRKFYISVNPIFTLEAGYDFFADRFIGKNTRGVALRADIGRKVSLYTAFTETQAKFPLYVSQQIDQSQVAPGEGKVKPFKGTGFDFSGITGYLSYSPIRQLNLEVGHGKHFIGDGYRSLLLSDNSFVYPYFKMTANFWRFQYSVILSEMINDVDLPRDFTLGFPRKLASFIYVSADLAPWLEIGAFEGIMWRRTNAEGNKAFDPNFLNPLIGVRSLQKGLDNNTLYGLNLKFTLPQSIILYSQLMVDNYTKDGITDFKSRMGIQGGIKYFDAFTARNLNLQLEVNSVRPYTYSFGDSALHYSHYAQPLAHPLGANFTEFVGLVDYRYKRLYGAWKVSFAKTALDREGFNDGTDIFKVNSTATFTGTTSIGQGLPYDLFQNEVRVGYIINPKINLTIEAKVLTRHVNSELGKVKNNVFFFTFSTQLFNHYYDFALSLE